MSTCQSLGADSEQGVRIHRLLATDLEHSVAAGEYHGVVLDDGDGQTGDAPVLDRLLDVGVQPLSALTARPPGGSPVAPLAEIADHPTEALGRVVPVGLHRAFGGGRVAPLDLVDDQRVLLH